MRIRKIFAYIAVILLATLTELLVFFLTKGDPKYNYIYPAITLAMVFGIFLVKDHAKKPDDWDL